MNCKKVQELILTDYLDNELKAYARDEIKAHLASCSRCREFEQAAQRDAHGLFRGLGPVQPPESVWQNIKGAIQQKQQQSVPVFLERLFDLVRESFVVRRPAYAFATAFTVILTVVFFMGQPARQKMLVKDYLIQKSAFMVALNKAPNGEIDSVVDFNTAIEQYLF